MKAYCIGKGRRWFLGPGIVAAAEMILGCRTLWCASRRAGTRHPPSCIRRENNIQEAGGFAPDQPFALSNGVVRVTLEKSYVPGIVRERRTFDFVPFCASDRVRTYFRADSRQKLVDDELYADPTRVADK